MGVEYTLHIDYEYYAYNSELNESVLINGGYEFERTLSSVLNRNSLLRHDYRRTHLVATCLLFHNDNGRLNN